MIITHNTGKSELCFVKVPTDSNEAEIVTNQAVIPYGQSLVVPDGYYKCFPNHKYIDLPEGNWQIVGNPFELSEEQCQDIVDVVWNGHNEKVFKDYLNDDWCPSAKSSFGSLLFNLNVHHTNPYKDGDPSIVNHDVWYSRAQWKEAEERTGLFILLKEIV